MGKQRARRVTLTATTVGVEAVMLAAAPGAWRGVAEPAPDTLAAERAGALLAGLLVLLATAAWSHWCLLMVATAAGDCRLAGLATRIDRAWRAWYAANRRTVGPDPDLLLVGQRLVPPIVVPERTPR